MQPDDLMPNDGTYFMPREPQDQIKSRRKERAETLESAVVLKQLIARLEDRIAFYGSVDAIPKAVKADPEKFLIVHNSNQLVRDVLRSEMEYILSIMS